MGDEGTTNNAGMGMVRTWIRVCVRPEGAGPGMDMDKGTQT